MNTNTPSPLQAAHLDATPAPDYAGDLCDWLTAMGRLDADALNAL